MLPESRPAGGRKQSEAGLWLHPGRFRPVLRKPVLAQLLFIGFFTMAAFVMMESTVGIFLIRVFDWDQLHIGLFFGYVGVIIIAVQGGMVGRLTKKYGEWPLSTLGPLLVAIGMVGFSVAGIARARFPDGVIEVGFSLGGFLTALGLVMTILCLLGGGAVNATGRSLQQPTLSSLLSQYSEPEEHGAVFGLFHGLGSLARAIGPLMAAPAARFLNTTGQFVLAGFIAALDGVVDEKPEAKGRGTGVGRGDERVERPAERPAKHTGSRSSRLRACPGNDSPGGTGGFRRRL